MDGKELKCSNCETRITPLWRKRGDGTYLCNACGLYRKIHGMDRPKEMKTEIVRHRRRARKNKVSWKAGMEIGNGDEHTTDTENATELASEAEEAPDCDNENICISDKNDKPKKKLKPIKKKKIRKKPMKVGTKEDTKGDEPSDKSYDDNFDYTIVKNLRNYRLTRGYGSTSLCYSKDEGFYDNYAAETILTSCTEDEITAIEGLLKLSKN